MSIILLKYFMILDGQEDFEEIKLSNYLSKLICISCKNNMNSFDHDKVIKVLKFILNCLKIQYTDEDLFNPSLNIHQLFAVFP